MSSPDQIVLIGPAATGKSTLGARLAAALARPFVDIDEIGDAYYAEAGWSIDRLVERIEAVGRVAAEREWEPARAHAVRRTLESHPGAVIALGAGHTSYTDPRQIAVVRAALAHAADVILVLPTLDRAAALDELRSRSVTTKGTDWIADGHDFLAEWFDDLGTRELARYVHVTGGETVEESVRRLISHLTSVTHHPERATGSTAGRTT